MIIQRYNLNMIPDKVPVMVRVSQYDQYSRTIIFSLYDGSIEYEIPSGSAISVRGTKPDHTGFEYPCTFEGNEVSFNIEPQQTVLSGLVPSEIRITSNNEIVGSCNFIINVEATPLDESTVISETDIPLIEEASQAALIAQGAAARAESEADRAESILSSAVKSVNYVLPDVNGNVNVDALPDGGTTGQVLTKQSSTDGDADWQDVNKMDFVSSPTADHFLATNPSGQAIDSGIAKSLIGAGTTLKTTNKTIIPAINELYDKFAYPKQYSAQGLIVNGSSLSIQGHGTFTATFFESGLVRVDFALRISAGDSSSSFNFGINKSLLSQLIPSMPDITPTNFAGAFTYYNSSGAINNDLTGYGGVACNPAQPQFWGFGRLYNTSGNRGGWPASSITEGTYITGYVYGTYTV